MPTEKLALEVFVKGFNQFNAHMNHMDRAIGRVGNSWSGATGPASAFASILTSVVKAAVIGLTIALGTATIALGNFLLSSVNTAISFESAFAGVTKTVEGLADQTGTLTEAGEELRQEFKDLADQIPVTFEELSRIGEIGGQLGVETDQLIKFTDTVARLGVSTDLTIEQAALSLSRFATIMATPQENFDRIGSTLIELGNNFAANESEIAQWILRVAGAGRIAGLTEADVLGVSTAFAAVGIQPAAGGTAVQKTLLSMASAAASFTEGVANNSTAIQSQQEHLADLNFELAVAQQRYAEATRESQRMVQGARIQDLQAEIEATGVVIESLVSTNGQAFTAGSEQLKLFAETAGLTIEEFATKFAEDPAQAFQMFVAGLGAAGTEAEGILKDLELGDSRLIRAFLSLAQNADVLEDALGKANDEWDRNLALTEESTIRFQTAENRIKLLKNRFSNIKDEIGMKFLPALGQLAEGIGQLLIEHGPELSSFFDGLAKSFEEAVPKIIEGVRNFFEVTLPTAIETGRTWLEFFKSFWDNTLLPLFQTLQDEWNAKGVPVIETLQEIFEMVLPLAIQVFSDIWETKFIPLWESLQEAWETVRPALEEFGSWLQSKLPGAIQALTDFWNTTLLPLLQTTWGFITQQFIPAIAEIAAWLLTNIPIAIDTFSTFWNEKVLPPLQALKAFWDDNLKPVFDAIIEYFSVLGKEAVETFGEVFKNDLAPILNTIWTFLKDSFIVAWETLSTLFKEEVIPIIRELKEDFELGLGLILEYVTEQTDSLHTGFSDLRTFLKDKLSPVIASVGEALETFLQRKLEDIKTTAEFVRIALEGVFGAWQDLQGISVENAVGNIGGSAINQALQRSVPVGGGNRTAPLTVGNTRSVTNNIFQNSTTDSRQFNLEATSILAPNELALEFETMSLGAR